VYFKFSLRKHPQSEKLSGYYRLVESYRNADNRVCHRTILNVGFMENVTADQLNKIQKQLTERYERKQTLFEQEQDDPIVKQYVEEPLATYCRIKKARPCIGRKIITHGTHGYAAA
jgi:endonuclease III